MGRIPHPDKPERAGAMIETWKDQPGHCSASDLTFHHAWDQDWI